MKKTTDNTEQLISLARDGVALPSRGEFREMLGRAGYRVREDNELVPSPYRFVVTHRRISLAAGTVIGLCAILLVVIPRFMAGPAYTGSAQDQIDGLVSELSAQADTEQSIATGDLDTENPGSADTDTLAQVSS